MAVVRLARLRRFSEIATFPTRWDVLFAVKWRVGENTLLTPPFPESDTARVYVNDFYFSSVAARGVFVNMSWLKAITGSRTTED